MCEDKEIKFISAILITKTRTYATSFALNTFNRLERFQYLFGLIQLLITYEGWLRGELMIHIFRIYTTRGN